MRHLMLTILANSKTFTTMKRFLYTLTALAIFATSCNNDNLGDNISLEKKTTISVEAIGDTRTYVENDQIFWSESGEQLNIVYYNDISTSSSRRQTATHADYTVVDNRATFTADFSLTEGATVYTLGAFSPYKYSYSTSSFSLAVPSEQTPTESSYDKAADILVSKEPVTVNGTPDKVQFAFARMVAIVNMTIKGIPAGEKIEKVVFSSPAKPNGTVTFSVHTPGTLDNATWYNNYEDTTINLGGRVATGNDEVWFTTVPTDLSGSSFTVTVTTESNIYTKTVDLTGKTLNFERADIAKFSVKDLAIQEKPKAYKLLTDIAELNAGDKVVICNRNYSTTNAKLLSTNITGSYQNYLSVISSMTVTEDVEILEDGLPADVAIFTLEAGETSGTFAFKEATKNYLYATRIYEDSYYDYLNILGFNDSKVAGTSWKIELDSSGAKMSTCYDGTNSRYLSSNGSNQFCAAASRSTSYNKYYIFYIDGESSEGGETPEQPVVTPLATPVVTATASGNTISVSWEAIEGAKDYTVTCGSHSLTVEFNGATFKELEYDTTYEVSVVANPSNSSLNSASEAGKASATTEKDPNQGGGEAQTVTITLPIDGAVSSNTVGTIYTGDITISSTGSWRTDNADGRDAIYIGRTTSNELRIEAASGKTITKVTLTAPVGYLVDLKCKEYDGYSTTTFASLTTAEWSGECKSRLVYTPAGNSHSNIASIVVEYK